MKESIKNLRNIAKESGYESWQDYIYEYCLNGNSVRSLCDKMSKGDTLTVIDATVAKIIDVANNSWYWNLDVLQKIYLGAYCSLADRL
mgnify:CR=1 FL=1